MAQILQGTTPEKISQSLTWGVLIGCFPLIGFATMLAFIFGYVFKLSHVIVQSTNYLMYPVQILLIPIYIKSASLLFDVGDIPLRPDLILDLFIKDPGSFIIQFGWVGVYAVIIWTFVSSIIYWFVNKAIMPKILLMSEKAKMEKQKLAQVQEKI